MKAIIVCIIALGLFGCKVKEPDINANGYTGNIKLTTLSDGTRCAVFLGHSKGGLSCNWKP